MAKGYDPPSQATVIQDAEASSQQPLLMQPKDFRLVWSDDAARDHGLAIWRPVPQDGCASMDNLPGVQLGPLPATTYPSVRNSASWHSSTYGACACMRIHIYAHSSDRVSVVLRRWLLTVEEDTALRVECSRQCESASSSRQFVLPALLNSGVSALFWWGADTWQWVMCAAVQLASNPTGLLCAASGETCTARVF